VASTGESIRTLSVAASFLALLLLFPHAQIATKRTYLVLPMA